MSLITRRSLFGLGVGAAAIPVVGIHRAKSAEIVVGLDFGTKPAGRIWLGEIEADIRFPDAIPDGTRWFGKRREVPAR